MTPAIAWKSVVLTISSLQGYVAYGKPEDLQTGLDRCLEMGISTEGIKSRRDVQSLIKRVLRPLELKHDDTRPRNMGR